MGRYDRAGVLRLSLDAVDAGVSLETLYGDVLEPMLQDLGAAWQRGERAVWQEHFASQALRTLLESLATRVLERKAAVPPVPVGVGFFCPEEESHELGLRMLADRFDLRGFRTVYVGAQTPAADIISAVKTLHLDIACLSASTHFQRTALRRVVTRLEAEVPGVRILVGGAAFTTASEEWAAYQVSDLGRLMKELAERVGTVS